MEASVEAMLERVADLKDQAGELPAIAAALRLRSNLPENRAGTPSAVKVDVDGSS